MRRSVIAGIVLCAVLLAGATWLWLQPPSAARLQAEAEREGAVRILGNADAEAVAPLIAAFRRQHPQLNVTYEDLQSSDLHRRFLADAAAAQPGVDIVWSSAMDLQAKLINDGHAQAYASPHKAALPPEALWKDMGYGITAEPVALVYNRRAIAPDRVPRTHRALEQLLTSGDPALRGRVATYDPAQSDVGYLYLTQDLAATRDTYALWRALAANDPVLASTTAEMVDAVAEGRAAIGYNVVGPYALQRAGADDWLGIVFLQDYTLVASRIAFIARDAPHPAAGRLFLDWMLSREGQALLAGEGLPPVRTDMANGGPDVAHPRAIPGGPQLFVNLDPVKRRRVLGEWDAILAEGAGS
ncbi:ABC transporter substrate-binding protein [Croceibacterium ferulae]|uniref:ABC transporter substrate-binding protein n=1 Tax=Croceibacterium ferulae TaxID=1854641 RepID=UPI000EB2F046|nr:ABC transporter substrate-binding protein [Croceibacterium ferulae]